MFCTSVVRFVVKEKVHGFLLAIIRRRYSPIMLTYQHLNG